MVHRRRSIAKADPADEGAAAVVLHISSDDEEANEDLSLVIVERARRREAKRERPEDALPRPPPAAEVITLSSSYSGEAELEPTPTPVESEGKKRKRKKLKKTKVHAAEEETPQLGGTAVEPLGTIGSTLTAANEAPDNNVVLRKLLRGPRYFDPGEGNWETCFNCGEEGHLAANCSMDKRQKPCFVCGIFGHNAKHCMKGQDCFICKRRGHIAKDCPDKHKKVCQVSKVCLHCGDVGHDMFTCRNDYPPDDMKEIQCYICKKHGHLCCADFEDSYPTEISCYNCAQSGHTGSGCAKPRGESSTVASPTLCYKCGEEGHFARGCTKFTKPNRWIGESSTPRKVAKKNIYSPGFRSAPHDFGKARKRKSPGYEERGNAAAVKSRIRGGWIVDDPGDIPLNKPRSNCWAASVSAVKRNNRNQYFDSDGDYSSPQSVKNQKHTFGSPSSNPSKSAPKHGYSASRFSNSHIRFG